jgi:energy-coupling factor transporter transmembrane protein EcfT
VLLIWLLAFLGLALGGVMRWLFRSYLLVLLPALLTVVLTWIVFNPTRDSEALLSVPVYNGRSLPIAVSRASLAVALTKGLGYGALILVSLLLMMTSRDTEITGAMRQFGVPYTASFFVSTMLRSLSMALEDHRTIRQAQIARGAALRRKGPINKLSELAQMAVPLTATMLRRSREIGDAALIRGLTMQTSDPTEFHQVQRFAVADWIVLTVCALLLIASFAFRFNLTRLLGVTW